MNSWPCIRRTSKSLGATRWRHSWAWQSNKSINIHLDNYIKDVLNDYSAYIKKSMRPKKVPISQGVVFKAEDIPDSPDPRKQKQYRSFVAKLQFAATWIRFDISFVVSQLARFCASAGEAQWAALHHLMEYLTAHPSFKINSRIGMKQVDLLSRYADADWGNSSSRRSTSGMIMLYNRSQIIRKSNMQKTTALSTAEADF